MKSIAQIMFLSHSWLPSAGKIEKSEIGKNNPPQKGYTLAVSSYLFINTLHTSISCDKDGTFPPPPPSLPEAFLFQSARSC